MAFVLPLLLYAAQNAFMSLLGLMSAKQISTMPLNKKYLRGRFYSSECSAVLQFVCDNIHKINASPCPATLCCVFVLCFLKPTLSTGICSYLKADTASYTNVCCRHCCFMEILSLANGSCNAWSQNTYIDLVQCCYSVDDDLWENQTVMEQLLRNIQQLLQRSFLSVVANMYSN